MWPNDATLLASKFPNNQVLHAIQTREAEQCISFELGMAFEDLGRIEPGAWFRRKRDTTRIYWLTDVSSRTKDGAEAITRLHITNMRSGTLPSSGAAFTQSFVVEIERKWLELCTEIRAHLWKSVSHLPAKLLSFFI